MLNAGCRMLDADSRAAGRGLLLVSDKQVIRLLLFSDKLVIRSLVVPRKTRHQFCLHAMV